MPIIVVEIEEGSNDRRNRGYRSGTTGTFPTGASGYEREADAPYATGIPVGGRDSSQALLENRLQLIFQDVEIPKDSKIKKAEITTFARVSIAQFGSPPMKFQITALDTTNTIAQTSFSSYTGAFTYASRDARGQFTLTAGETSYVEKTVDVTELVQELVNQFNFSGQGSNSGSDHMTFQMRNSSFTNTQQAYPYPRPTTIGGPSTEIRGQIYSANQGVLKQSRLTVTYSNPCTETLCDDFRYSVNEFLGSEGRVPLTDPAIFGNQTVADDAYPSSDTARIRINGPPFGGSNRLDITCPSGVTHNASGTGESGGGFAGTIPQGVDDTNFNYRFKIDITSFTINTDATSQSVHIGLSDSDTTVFADAVQKYIGLKISTVGSSSSFDLIGADGIAPDSAGAILGTFTTLPSTGIFYVELVKLGNNNAGLSEISCALYTDFDYTDLIEKVTGTMSDGAIGLDRLKFMAKNDDGTGNGDITLEFGQREGNTSILIVGRMTVWNRHSVARNISIEIPTFEDDLATPAIHVEDFSGDNWNDTGTGFGVNAGNDNMEWTADDSGANNASSIGTSSLGDTFLTKEGWTLRFKLDIDNLTIGSSAVENRVFIGGSDSDETASTSTAQDFIGLGIGIDNTNARFFITHGQNQSIFSNTTDFVTAIPSVGTVYVEICRTSLTGMTINIYSDEAFTNLTESISDTISSSIAIADEVKLQSRNDGASADSTLNGIIDDLFVYGSLNPVPSNWDQIGTKIVANEMNPDFNEPEGQIEWDSSIDGSSSTLIHDLGSTISDEEWTLRFKFLTSTLTTGDSTGKYMWIGLFDSDETVDSETSQDFISFFFFTASGGTTYDGMAGDGVTLSSLPNRVSFTSTPTASDVYYVELKRTSSTTAKCTLFSDPDYTNVLETITLTIPSGITGLRYLGLKNRNIASATGGMTGETDDIKFWNGQEALEQDNLWKVSD